MNRVEELIQQLCPNGVEWKKLGDYIELYTGEQLNKDAMLSDGVYPVMNGGVLASGFTDSFNEEADTITISQGGASAGFVNWMESKFWAGAHCFIVKVIDDKIINRYLYFFLKNSERKMMLSKYGAGIPSLSKESVNKLLIPIPPLPIQQEIVRILDTFTELTANLQTELDARKKQYAYYRDCLLNFEGVDGVEWKKLGEVCEKTYNIKWDTCDNIYQYIDLSSVNINNHNIEETQEINKENAPSRAQQIVLYNDVLLGTTRPMLKRICIIPLEYNEQICSTGFCVLRVNKNILLPRFLYFFISTNSFFDYVEKNQEGAGYPSISNIKIFKFQIPVPPLPEQRRIVAILDHFETLVNDLSVGLPAELEARRKQYEYYRDQLLTFDRV